MPPIKTQTRESYFLASIFSKTLILFSKTQTQPLRTFLQIKNLYLVSSKEENIFQNWFLKTFFKSFYSWVVITNNCGVL